MYKTLCFCGSLIRSIQSCQINAILADHLNLKGLSFFIHTVFEAQQSTPKFKFYFVIHTL